MKNGQKSMCKKQRGGGRVVNMKINQEKMELSETVGGESKRQRK